MWASFRGAGQSPAAPPAWFNKFYVPPGFIATNNAIAWGEASDPTNSAGRRIGMGTLAVVSSPVAVVEETARGGLNTTYNALTGGWDLGTKVFMANEAAKAQDGWMTLAWTYDAAASGTRTFSEIVIAAEGVRGATAPLGAHAPSPCSTLGGTGDTFVPPKVFTNRHGQLSNGAYVLDDAGMAPHTTGSFAQGKSQFLYRINEKELVLNGSAYADAAGLWSNNKAKLFLDGFLGVHGKTGELTNVLNLYRTESGFVHGAPGSPR